MIQHDRMEGSVFILKAKNDSKAKSQVEIKKYIITLFASSIIILTILCMLTFLSSKLILNNPIETEAYKFIMTLNIMISSFVGGFISSHRIKKNGMITGVLSGIPVLAIITIVVFSLTKNITYFLPVVLCISIISCALGGIIGVNFKKRKR